MQFDLLKSFMFTEARRGRPFELSEAVSEHINEVLDRLNRKRQEQTAATERPSLSEVTTSEADGGNTLVAS